MFEALFGTEMVVRVLVAFLIFVVVMVGFWGIRRLGGPRLGTNTVRGRQPRLAIIDAAPVDGRRRLVLVRRDNVEHLLMIGGPSDIVIEQNIVRPVPLAAPKEVPASRMPGLPEAMPRSQEPPPPPRSVDRAPNWPELGPRLEPGMRSEPALRLDQRSDPAPRPDQRSEPTRPLRLSEHRTSAASEPGPRASPEGEFPMMIRPAPSVAPVPRPTEPGNLSESEEPPPSDAELTEMAQRLEAALRRPMAQPPEDRTEAPPAKPAAPTEPPARAGTGSPLPFGAPPPIREAPKIDPARSPGPNTPFGAPPVREGPKMEPRPPAPEPARASGEQKPSPRSVFDSLEQEMASLLGRPVGKE
jgi:flagellar protein FliO/FliZ